MKGHFDYNLMLAAALASHISYDKATEISEFAYK